MPAKRRITQFDFQGNRIAEFDSATQAAQHVNGQPSPIVQCCLKRVKSAYQYQWQYSDDPEPMTPVVYDRKKPVTQYDLQGNKLYEYDSARHAERSTKINNAAILKCCIGKCSAAGNYQWRYTRDNLEKLEPIIPYKKPVEQYTLDGTFVAAYTSTNAAAKALGKKSTQLIISCCIGERDCAYNYQWKYVHDTQKQIHPLPPSIPKSAVRPYRVAIRQYDNQGHYINTFESTEDAARTIDPDNIGKARSAIRASLLQQTALAYNCVWRYAYSCQEADIDITDVFLDNNLHYKAVVQYDLSGHYLAVYPSLAAASTALQKNDASCICKCCKGNIQTAYGYLWTLLADNPTLQDIPPVSSAARPRTKKQK